MKVSRPPQRAPDPELAFARWILWEDDGLLAVNKPAGVLSQGGEGGAGRNVVDLARAHLGRGDIGVLHRIDRNVSGVVLVAKEPKAARAMTRLVAAGGLTRVYRAVVQGRAGRPVAPTFVVDAWLAKDERTNEVEALDGEAVGQLSPAERGRFRPARTEVRDRGRVAAPLGRCHVLEVRPVTGRSHQIRVHLAHVGVPIVGDPKYGVAARMGGAPLNRPLLHAECVVFLHPRTGKEVTLQAPVPWTDDELATLQPAVSAPRAMEQRPPPRRRR